MTDKALIRTRLLFGDEATHKLQRSRVALFGLGGVGGYALEALVRSGVGALDLVDCDVFSESNLNRQLLATRETLGRSKAIPFSTVGKATFKPGKTADKLTLNPVTAVIYRLEQ